MKRNSKISVAIHALMHIAGDKNGPLTSDTLADCLDTNPVVVRRVLGKLRKTDIVSSEKGHGGGWSLCKEPEEITLLDIYTSIGESILPDIKMPTESEKCLIVRSISTTMLEFVEDAQSLLESRLRRISLKTFIDNVESNLTEHG